MNITISVSEYKELLSKSLAFEAIKRFIGKEKVYYASEIFEVIKSFEKVEDSGVTTNDTP